MVEITFSHLNLRAEKDIADWVCIVKVDGKAVYYGELGEYHAEGKESWKALLKRVADDIKKKQDKSDVAKAL